MLLSRSVAPRWPALLVLLAIVIIVIAGSGLYLSRTSPMSPIAASELPPGLVKGAQFQILISSGGGIGTETLAVIDTNGTWVHADVVNSNVWGKGDIWVNLASTDFGYVNVIGKPQPPK